MSICDRLDRKTLELTLKGFTDSFKHVLGVSSFVQQFHNNWKQVLRASTGTKYPYGGFKLTTVQLQHDKNLVNMARVGTGQGVSHTPINTSISRAYLFPVQLQLECVVKFNDPVEAQMWAVAAAIMFSTRQLSFKLSLGPDHWTVNCTANGDQSASMTMPYTEDLNDSGASTPGSVELQFQLLLDTKIGFFTEVQKLNNDGAISMSVTQGTETKNVTVS